jgi:hypothetical protein
MILITDDETPTIPQTSSGSASVTIRDLASTGDLESDYQGGDLEQDYWWHGIYSIDTGGLEYSPGDEDTSGMIVFYSSYNDNLCDFTTPIDDKKGHILSDFTGILTPFPNNGGPFNCGQYGENNCIESGTLYDEGPSLTAETYASIILDE